MPRRRVTSLLTNEQLARVERLRLQTARRFTNRSQGQHRSRRGGRSIEFKDYRDYAAGDDIRFLDWNVLARLQRACVRLYHDEEELHLVLLVDASASMAFGGKLRMAQQLAAALGVMGLVGGERVSAHVFAGCGDPRMTDQVRPARGRRGIPELLAALEKAEAGGDNSLERGVEAMLRVHRGRGVLVVVSDFLTAGDLRPCFNRAHGRGLEVFGLQVLGADELRPELGGDVRLVDSETGEVLDVSGADELLALYQAHRLEHERGIRSMCQQRGGRFAVVDASAALDDVLFEGLRRRGWVR